MVGLVYTVEPLVRICDNLLQDPIPALDTCCQTWSEGEIVLEENWVACPGKMISVFYTELFGALMQMFYTKNL